MKKDHQYKNFIPGKDIVHHYGKNVHILGDPLLLTLVVKIGSPATKQPVINDSLKIVYERLFCRAITDLFPLEDKSIPTRMKTYTSKGIYHGPVLDEDTLAVCVDIARAGTIPSQTGHDLLVRLLNPDNVRQDHIYASRTVDKKQRVTGVSFAGAKIGGDIKNAILLIGDPMGATGSTIADVINHYKNNFKGPAKAFVSLHLIVTPEYILKMKKEHPKLHIYAARLDRGLSSKKVLESCLGKYIHEEKGLNERQYIVPGAGGLGEIINNAYV